MCGAIIEMAGHTRLKLVNSVIKVSLAILLNFILIPRYGIVGAAVAALVHEVISNLLPLVQIWFLYRLLPFSQGLIKPILAGLAMAATWMATNRWFPSQPDQMNYFVIGLHILFLCSIYLAVTLLLGFSPQERALFARFKRRIVAQH